MSDQNSNKSPQTQTRLTLLKSGFKQFVTTIRVPLSAETKWMLEIVCLNEMPKPPNNNQNSITDRAKFYLHDHLWRMQTSITANKQDWVAAMKNS